MKKLLTALKYALFFGVGLGLFLFLLKDFKLSEIKELAGRLNYFWLTICFVFTILSHYIRGWRWALIIEPMGYPVRKISCFIAVMTGYFANLALPRMGEISRCVVVNRTEKIPVDKLIGTVVVERIIDVISLLILCLLTFILEFKRLEGFINQYILSKFNASPENAGNGSNTLIIIGVLVALTIIGIVTARFIFKKFSDHKVILKVKGILSNFGDGIKSVSKMKNKWLFIFLSISMWLCYYFMVYFCFFSISETSHLGLLTALTVLTLGSFGFVAPVQGGIGAYHWIVAQTLLMYGLSEKDGLSYALVAHSFQTLAIIVVGAISFFSISFFVKSRKESPTLFNDNNGLDVIPDPSEITIEIK